MNVLCMLCACLTCVLAHHYTNEWAVEIDGDPETAQRIAHKYGFIYKTQILDGIHLLVHNDISKRSIEPSQHHHNLLKEHPQVKWLEQQVVKRRVKRDFLSYNNKRRPLNTHQYLNDPRWPQMWYLNRGNSLDMNVDEAWSSGVTGAGVVVTILDDGLEQDHPDLVANYDDQASYDVNDHDGNPQPRYDLINSNKHGTRCAGEVAADANNSICAVGVAYKAKVGGVRMLDGDVTDAVEARSLSLNNDHIDIYSASWGPDDDGKTVDGPGVLATKAFVEGILKGRRGYGSIFVWASGNGGREYDNCNCDGYTNSIWTLSISSATEHGDVPWYSEACSSTMATTYSSGANGEKQIVTTDLHHGCTSSHTGTSASAPLAAGICALALEANPTLTWRDLQHIVIRTARPQNLNALDWQTNGVGRNVSHSFGYGLMDASAMVRLARKWKTVPEQNKCEVSSSHVNKLIPAKSRVALPLHVATCPQTQFLEHVQAKVSLSAIRRGDIELILVSPSGTRSTLLARRTYDSSSGGFQDWPFMTVHNWGENPTGKWQLVIQNEGRYLATLNEWGLVMFGTETDGDSTSSESITVSSAAPSCKTAGCRDCPGNYFQNGSCVDECIGKFYGSKKLHECLPCHYSCKTCLGPNDYECLSCHDDALLDETSYCRPKDLMHMLSSSYYFHKYVVAAFIILFALTVCLLFALCILQYKKSRKGKYVLLNGQAEKAVMPITALPYDGTIIPYEESDGDT